METHNWSRCGESVAVEGSVLKRTFTSPLWPWKRLICLHYGSKVDETENCEV